MTKNPLDELQKYSPKLERYQNLDIGVMDKDDSGLFVTVEDVVKLIETHYVPKAKIDARVEYLESNHPNLSSRTGNTKRSAIIRELQKLRDGEV